MITNNGVIHQIHFRTQIKPSLMDFILPWFPNLNECARLMNPMQLWECKILVANATFSWTIGHQISSAIASLMHETMKMALS